MKHRIAAQVSGLLAAALLVVPALQAADTNQSGKQIYDRNCAFCHGVDGEADTPVGRILSPRPRRFADPVEMARLTDDQIYRAIEDGKPGTAMASWAKVLNESQIGDVMDYIHQLEGGGKPATMSEQQLSLAVGRRIYDKECSFCHGLKGDADTDAAKVLKPPPVKFADPIAMARVDDGRMYAAIKLGVPGSAMASWGSLMTPVEIIDVMRYVRSLQQPLPDVITKDRLDVIVGGNIYHEYCVACHGEKGNADTVLGRVLTPHPRNFTSRRQMAKLTDQKMMDAIMHGRPGTAMASWGGILNPEDIRRVIRYIRATFIPKS